MYDEIVLVDFVDKSTLHLKRHKEPVALKFYEILSFSIKKKLFCFDLPDYLFLFGWSCFYSAVVW